MDCHSPVDRGSYLLLQNNFQFSAFSFSERTGFCGGEMKRDYGTNKIGFGCLVLEKTPALNPVPKTKDLTPKTYFRLFRNLSSFHHHKIRCAQQFFRIVVSLISVGAAYHRVFALSIDLNSVWLMSPLPSLTTIILFTPMFSSLVVVPLGQRISIRSIFVRFSSPKCSRRSLCEI